MKEVKNIFMFTQDEKNKFLDQVYKKLSENPLWLRETIDLAIKGFYEQLSREIDKRANAEIALSVIFDNIKDIPEHQKEIVVKALVNSKFFGGTKYVEELKRKYLKS